MTKRVADLAWERWLNGNPATEKEWRIHEIDHQIWISSIRRYNALKSNYQRWRVNKTGHRRDE